MVRTSDVMEIKGSPVKLVGLFALGVLMTGVSAALAFRWFPSGTSAAWGWFGLLFFGLCTALSLWRLLTAGRTVVTISPHGIKDVRLSADVVPWSGVQDISTAKIKRQKFIVIAVEPSIEARLTFTPIARWSRGPNRMLGIDGLCISAIGLKTDHDTLFRECLVHWQAVRR
jgi:hypothetical protein